MSTYSLPDDSAERKLVPIYSGFYRYFPAAIVGVAKLSMAGHLKHCAGFAELTHNRTASNDHADCVMRHVMDAMEASKRGDRARLQLELDALAWRSLAWSQVEKENDGAARAPAASALDTASASASDDVILKSESESDPKREFRREIKGARFYVDRCQSP